MVKLEDAAEQLQFLLTACGDFRSKYPNGRSDSAQRPAPSASTPRDSGNLT